MKYRELTVLLPCHSLEDFPLYHVGQDAESLLACWTALWHPALISAADSPPSWHRVDLPPEDLHEKLILVPTVSVGQLPAGFAQLAKDAGALLLRSEYDRGAILDAALQQLDGGSAAIDQELVADFLALGYAYLQVQMLTRQMRYASNLDEVHFFNQLLAGAKAAQAGQVEEAHGKLTACFDLLAEERDHYYSVDAYLIDLTLVAEQTLGAELRNELAGGTTVNLLMAGKLTALLQEREPESFLALVAAIADGRAGLVGGEEEERRLPLLSCESVLASLRQGQRTYERLLGHRVEVYGRRTFGLTPFLPGILEKMRFRGALHATLDDGHFPAGSQIKTRWQGVEASVIDAIAKPPLDAGKPETFLSYAQKLGGSMDTDHVATLCLAHWPGHACTWYQDLKRCTRFTSALGKFITVERYFADTYLPGHLDRFEADQYKTPYLRQDVIRKRPNPISSVVNYWQHRIAADASQAIGTLLSVVGNEPCSVASEASELVENSPPEATKQDVDDQLAAELVRERNRFAEILPRQQSLSQTAYLVVNPCSFARREGFDVSELSTLPARENPVYVADEVNGRKLAVVDVPPMGFVWITSGSGGPRTKRDEPSLAEDARERGDVLWLRNEFLEASISQVTGGLQVLTDYKSRGNRLSQQLALRTAGERGQEGNAWRDSDESAVYSVMAADEVRVLSSSAALGEIKTRGRLLDRDGQPVAAFQQTWRLWRGSRVLQLDIKLDPVTEPSSDPWNSYYACRFAWSDETADLFHAVNQTRQPVTKKRIESPLYIDVQSGDQRTSLLTCGLPYHRKVNARMLDSLLIVRGESARDFRLGIGLDLNQPLSEAMGLLMPLTALRESAPPPVPTNCWLFHIDGRSIVATHWSPVVQEGKLVGVRVRLLEGGGRGGRARLTGFRAFTTARQLSFLGETLSDLSINDGKVVWDMTSHEWIEIEARWS